MEKGLRCDIEDVRVRDLQLPPETDLTAKLPGNIGIYERPREGYCCDPLLVNDFNKQKRTCQN
jgi:hypothetical protein